MTNLQMPKMTRFLAKMMLVLVSSVSVMARAQAPSFFTSVTPQVSETCECVAYYQCKPDGHKNNEGEGVIDIRLGPLDQIFQNRTKCGHYLEVCCLPEEKPTTTSPILPDGIEVFPQNPKDVIPGSQPFGGSVDSSQGVSVSPLPEADNPDVTKPNEIYGAQQHHNRGCGYRNPNGVSFRITGNFQNEANFAEFPWMVAIFRMESDSRSGKTEMIYQCGGSLIHPRVVLTAAHCVAEKQANQINIRVGEWDTQTQREPLPHQDRRVLIIETHPNYRPKILHYDFALLILDTPVILADNVEIACLPEQNQIIESRNCFATGWGKDNFGEQGRYQVILKAVELPTVAHQKCQTDLRSTRLGHTFRLHDTFMCAGGELGRDTCTGDGGSPLVCPLPHDKSRYVQTGIVAWGIGCAQQNVPGVYADVAKAREWIDTRLSTYRIDSSSYIPSYTASSIDSSNPSDPNWGVFDQRKFHPSQVQNRGFK